MNYALLDHSEVTKSMTVDDVKSEYTEVFGKYHGQSLPSNDELEKQLPKEKAPRRDSQSNARASDLNFTGGMGKRVIDDIITGDLALQARATVGKRAKLQDETTELFKESKALMLDNPTGGKLVTHNCYWLKEELRDGVIRRETMRNVELYKSRVKIFDEYIEYKARVEKLIHDSPIIQDYDAAQLAIIIVFLRPKQIGYAKGLKKGEDIEVLRKRAIQLWVKADAEGFPSAPPQLAAMQREAVREYFVKKQRDEEEERKQK